jgi:hypothetical protein
MYPSLVPLLALEGEVPSIPAALTAMITQLFSVVGTVSTTVVANPVMCIGIAATIGGIAIGWFKSLTGQRKKHKG